MNTRLLAAGCVTLMSSMLVSAQTSQTARQTTPAAAPVAAEAAKQQAVIKQLASQVKIIQKQLDKIAGSIDRIKSIPIGKRKKK